jgi:hypothetical protein
LPAAAGGGAAEAGVDPAAIGVLRGQIDALDKAIARLVAERIRLSERIQSARLIAGGTRMELGRERTILGTTGLGWATRAPRLPRQCCGSAGALGRGRNTHFSRPYSLQISSASVP